jgi:hypothetical protein
MCCAIALGLPFVCRLGWFRGFDRVIVASANRSAVIRVTMTRTPATRLIAVHVPVCAECESEHRELLPIGADAGMPLVAVPVFWV